MVLFRFVAMDWFLEVLNPPIIAQIQHFFLGRALNKPPSEFKTE